MIMLSNCGAAVVPVVLKSYAIDCAIVSESGANSLLGLLWKTMKTANELILPKPGMVSYIFRNKIN